MTNDEIRQRAATMSRPDREYCLRVAALIVEKGNGDFSSYVDDGVICTEIRRLVNITDDTGRFADGKPELT
jgi:hypothetical protein